jgi:hypothetical protein
LALEGRIRRWGEEVVNSCTVLKRVVPNKYGKKREVGKMKCAVFVSLTEQLDAILYVTS